MPKHEETKIDMSSELKVEIPLELKKQFLKGIDISDIGKIDLREAEDIAREGIAAFFENAHVENTHVEPSIESNAGAASKAKRVPDEPERTPVSITIRDHLEHAEESPPASAHPKSAREERGADVEDSRIWVPIESLTAVDIEEKQWVPLERIDEGTSVFPEKPELSEHADFLPLQDKPEPELRTFSETTVLTGALATSLAEHEGSDLDALAGEIVQFEEGESYTMREADVEEDRVLVANVISDFASRYDDQFIDWEKRYYDDELDFIHAAIVEEDYSAYIWEIDDFSNVGGTRTFSSAVELLGLTADEQDSIEDVMFDREFKTAGIYGRYQLFEFGKTEKESGGGGRINYRYLLPHEDSLRDQERVSIEDDISSGTALIFEEDVEEIKNEFKRKTGKAILDDYQIDLITDITDRVVILDDESDVERFIQGFPEKKRVDIKTLLKYLNGLFDKLPEEAIKKFAGSEYFDLYLKILRELGV